MDRAPIIFEDGRQVRDFINIRDVVSANLLVLTHPDADYQVFNVGGGKAWTVSDFYARMQQVVGKTIPPVVSTYYRYGDTRHIFSDTRKLQGLGWQPAYGVEDSIRDYWQYLHQADKQADILAFAESRMKRLNVIRGVKG